MELLLVEWVLTTGDRVLGLAIAIIIIFSAWWKAPFWWGGKRWYKHYKDGRNAWRGAMMDIAKEQNKIMAAQAAEQNRKMDEQTHLIKKIDTRVEKMEKEFYVNGGLTIKDDLHSIGREVKDIQMGQRITREVLDMIYWESDETGKVEYVSITLCDLLGCDQNQILGNSWVGLVKEEDRRRIIENWKLSVSNASLFKEEFTFLGCNNEEVKVLATARHTKDKQQKLLKSLVRFQPINN